MTGQDDERAPAETEDDTFVRQIEEKARRRLRARGKEARAIWHGLGAFGMVGWSIAIPTLLGVLLGAWLDANWRSSLPWTLMLLVAGLVIGCISAWQWVAREHQEMIDEREEQE